MNTSVFCFLLSLFVLQCAAENDTLSICSHKAPDIPTSWIDMEDGCVKKMSAQIKEELKASMQYLAMGAYFSRDSVNLPGFAKMFFESASEEREHAIKLISYLLMRGGLTQNVGELMKTYYEPPTISWTNGLEALKQALELEAKVTKSIRDVIATCENSNDYNDYHLVDYLTGVYLEEQYTGQREIAGRVSNLVKMQDKHGALGQFLYDKKLLDA